MTKRLFDLGVLILAAPFLLPVLLVTAALVRVKMGAPILFRQPRPGLHGRVFHLFKFRTMTDARDSHGALLPDDVRLTRFGRFLRASSLDELPCLWNVVRGEMSLVGPRPLLVDYLPLYSSMQMRRHDVPPGVTGLAQVNGRNSLSWEDKFALDLDYVQDHGIRRDIHILFLTVAKVFQREGISAAGQATMTRFLGSPNG